MPWAILIRLLARFAASLFFWRMATRRRTAFPGGQTAAGTPPKPRQIDAQAALDAVKTSVSLTWRALLATAYAAGALVAGAAGVTIIILTPRWLGAILLAAGIASGVAAVFEGRLLFLTLRARSRRRRDERLRKSAAS